MRLAVIAGVICALSATLPAAGSVALPTVLERDAMVDAVLATPELAQHAYLKSSNSELIDTFGTSVAVDGDTLVIGAPGEDGSGTGVNPPVNNSSAGSGAVYVFERSGGVWSQTAYIKASNPGNSDAFGQAVAIDGDTIVVGAHKENGDGSSQANDDVNDAGAAYVFFRSGGVWAQQAYLKASNIDELDEFGSAVAVDGDTIVVGMHFEDGPSETDPNSGAAYVFTRSGTIWTTQAILRASNVDDLDEFGKSVGISGGTIVIGADKEDSNATTINGDATNNSAAEAGAAYVFVGGGAIWNLQAYLKPSNAGTLDEFGRAVAISGDTIVVGAPLEDSNATGVDGDATNNGSSFAGAAYVYKRTTGTWSQQAYLKATNTFQGDAFGASVAVAGDRVLVGALGEDGDVTGVNAFRRDEGASASGAAYAYARTGNAWSPLAYIKASNSGVDDDFGKDVAIDADDLVVGAEFEDSNATTVNGNDDNDGAANSGAAYVYGASCPTMPFPDVATSHPFCAEIEWMRQTGISTGFGDGTYKPGDDVTRQAMSAFLSRLRSASLTTCAMQPFSDVPTNHPFCKEIKWMKDNGISTGFGDGTYKPGDDVTRQAMSAFLSRMRLDQSALPPCATEPFPDVPTSHPFCKEIKWMKDNGISTGFGDGTYRPGEDVTRQAMSAFLYRVVPLI